MSRRADIKTGIFARGSFVGEFGSGENPRSRPGVGQHAFRGAHARVGEFANKIGALNETARTRDTGVEVKKARRCFALSAWCGLGFVLALPVLVPVLQTLGVKPDTPLLSILAIQLTVVQMRPLPAGAWAVLLLMVGTLVLLLLAVLLFLAGVISLLVSRFSSTSS